MAQASTLHQARNLIDSDGFCAYPKFQYSNISSDCAMQLIIDISQDLRPDGLSQEELQTINQIVQETIRRYLAKRSGATIRRAPRPRLSQAQLIREAARQSRLVSARSDPEAELWENDTDITDWH